MTRTIDGTTYSLSLTDTAGQEEYRGLWSSSNLTSDAFLLVYDITNDESLRQLEYFNQLIEVERETRMEKRRVLPVCIVAGNKCDLQSMRQVSASQGLEIARARGYGFMETSAREMVNIEETFARESSPNAPGTQLSGLTVFLLQSLSAASSRHARTTSEVLRLRSLRPQRGRPRWIPRPRTRSTSPAVRPIIGTTHRPIGRREGCQGSLPA